MESMVWPLRKVPRKEKARWTLPRQRADECGLSEFASHTAAGTVSCDDGDDSPVAA